MDVDGNRGETVILFPFDTNWNKHVIQYAWMSVMDRMEQIKHRLSEDERHAIEATALVCSGGTRDNSAFLDLLRWWAASGHDYEAFMETTIVFKLKCGQSAFALKFFEALETGKLSYLFNTAVCSVDSSQDTVQVRTSDWRQLLVSRSIEKETRRCAICKLGLG
jgi:hypothetical protein